MSFSRFKHSFRWLRAISSMSQKDEQTHKSTGFQSFSSMSLIASHRRAPLNLLWSFSLRRSLRRHHWGSSGWSLHQTTRASCGALTEWQDYDEKQNLFVLMALSSDWFNLKSSCSEPGGALISLMGAVRCWKTQRHLAHYDSSAESQFCWNPLKGRGLRQNRSWDWRYCSLYNEQFPLSTLIGRGTLETEAREPINAYWWPHDNWILNKWAKL